MKVGEIFTAERIINGGTGYRYAPVRLPGFDSRRQSGFQ